MTKKKGISWKRVIVALVFFVPVIFIIAFIALFFLPNECPNTPQLKTVNIKKLRWNSGTYEVYFIDRNKDFQNVLYSILSDGSGKKIIYNAEPISDFVLINPTKKILIDASDHYVIVDQRGGNARTIPIELGYDLQRIKVAPDGKHLIGAKQLNLGKEIIYDYYIVNLEDGSNKKIASSDRYPLYFDRFYWFQSGNEILLTYSKGLSMIYSVYDLTSKDLRVLAEQQIESWGKVEKSPFDFVDKNKLAIDSRLAVRTSPTKGIVADTVSKNLFIDGAEIAHYCGPHSRSLSIPKFAGYKDPVWFPDEQHLIVGDYFDVLIVEHNTRLIAKLTDGEHPQVFR